MKKTQFEKDVEAGKIHKVVLYVQIGDAPSFYIDEWASDELARPLIDKLRNALDAGEGVPIEARKLFSDVGFKCMAQAHFPPITFREERKK